MPATTSNPASRSLFNLLRRRVVTLGMLGLGVFFMGQFALFTYLRPFLESVTGMDVGQITLVLLVIGGAGFVGTLMISRAIKRSIYLTLIIIPLLMAAIALTLIVFGHWPAAVIALLGGWGFISTAAPVAWWAWLARTLPDNAEAGGGLMVAVIQLSIAFGSTLGGLLFDWQGYQSTFIASTGLLLFAAALIFTTSRTE